MTVRITAWLTFLLLAPLSTASAQYFDQLAIADFLNRRAESLAAIPEVSYAYYKLSSGTGNSVYARNNFFMDLGKGQAIKGQEMAMLVGLLNRTTMNEVFIDDTLVVPTKFDLDFRAFSPFPRYYTGGREFDKLFIMDKTAQAFAAYEYGELVRWGIINTGNPDESPTPNGRYNFNWREEYRVSSLSPPGEEWEMYWVVNFHQARGMHIHQYEMPTGGPTSHGCVRLVDADAEWSYNWIDTWKTTVRGDGFASGSGRVLEQGTTVLVIGTEPEGKPIPFDYKAYGPILKRVDLPAHPYDLPPGTFQQAYFDRRRPARPAILIAADEPPAEEDAPVVETLTEEAVTPPSESVTDDALLLAETTLAIQDAPVDEATNLDAEQPVDVETPRADAATDDEEPAYDALLPLPFVDIPLTDAEQFPALETGAVEEQTDGEQFLEDTQAADEEILALTQAERIAEAQPIAAEEPTDNVTPTDDDAQGAAERQRTDDIEEAALTKDPDADEKQPDDETPAEQHTDNEQPAQDHLDLEKTSWTIVTASYLAQAEAVLTAAQYREQLRSTGYLVNVIETPDGSETAYRVVIGQFETLAATLTAQQELGENIPNNAWQFYLEPIANVVLLTEALPSNDEHGADDVQLEDKKQADDEESAVPIAEQEGDEEKQPTDDDAQGAVEMQRTDDIEEALLTKDPDADEKQPDDETPAEQHTDNEQPAEQEPVELKQPAPERFDLKKTSWTIVVASYPALADADVAAARYREQLRSTGYLIDVIEAFSGGVSEYRVVVGQFESLVTSSVVQQELADAIPFDAWLLYVEQEP